MKKIVAIFDSKNKKSLKHNYCGTICTNPNLGKVGTFGIIEKEIEISKDNERDKQ